jgi:hypothetical protein
MPKEEEPGFINNLGNVNLKNRYIYNVTNNVSSETLTTGC